MRHESQLGLPFRAPTPAGDELLVIAGRPVPVSFVRRRRARHYILRVVADGRLVVTVPWNGSRAEARRFVEERREWVERERYRRALDAGRQRPWSSGTPVLFRGEDHTLQAVPLPDGRVRVMFADQAVSVPAADAANLRAPVERLMRRCAMTALPERLARLAATHGFAVKAVSIRNQRSRWGSCSASGRISLNWRLIQFPAAIADYVMIHELVHLRHLNHSQAFWAEVARLCPAYRDARAWLRHHRRD